MCKNGGRPKFFWGGKKTKGNFSLKFLIFLTHMLSPTLNYSLTKSSHCEKTGCKTSLAQLSQDLLSTHCKMKKTVSASQKRRKNCHFGVCFSESGMEIAKQKPGSEENTSHAWPSQKGMAISENVGLYRSPKLRRKAVFFFRSEKAEFSTRAAQDIPQKNRSKIGFSVAFPFWKKEKKEKKRIGLVSL